MSDTQGDARLALRVLRAPVTHSTGICDGPGCGNILSKQIGGRPVQTTRTTIHVSATRQVVMDVYSISIPTRPGNHVMAVLYVHFQDGSNAYGDERFCRKCMDIVHPEILEALTSSQTDWV